MIALVLALSSLDPAEQRQAAGCEVVQSTFKEARARPFPRPDTLESVEVAAMPSFCVGWTVYDFQFVHYGMGGEPQWRGRRQRLSYFGELTTDWLESKNCPALVSVMDKLAQIQVKLAPTWRPIQIINGNRLPPPTPPPEDGIEYTLTLYHAVQSDDSSLRVTASSNYGPVARWAENDLGSLANCWHSPT